MLVLECEQIHRLLAFLLPLFIWVSQILHFVHLSFLDRTVPIRTNVTLLSIESRCLISAAAKLSATIYAVSHYWELNID